MTNAASFLAARDFLLAHRTDYAAARAGFRWPELERFNWALDYFDPMAAGNTATALRIVDEAGGDTALTFTEIAERSSRIANHWRRLGLRRGDRVLLMLGNVVPLWECMLAAMKLGAVVIPATTLLNRDDLLDRFERGRVRHVVTSPEHTAKFADLPGDYTRICIGGAPGWVTYEDGHAEPAAFEPDGQTDATDPLLLYFTSGTTARPKLVLHSHASYPVGHLSTMFWLGVQPGDVHVNISSPGWAKHAWSCFFAPWNAGATILLFNQPRFAAKPLLDALVRCNVTTFCAPPTVWRMLIQEDLKSWKTSLREVIGAGEPLNPEVIEQVRAAWGLTIRDGYGQTETTAQIGNSPGQMVKPGSMGRPLPGYRIAFSEEGEISLPLDPPPLGLMQGYQADDGSVLPIAGEMYRTGDVATQDADGYITYVGRADDVFKASDYRISPFELESVLIEHAAVAEAAVIPSPDAMRLAVPKAFIVLAGSHQPTRETALSIFRHVKESISPFKRIRRIEFRELPKTISGKIRRVELRADEQTARDAQRRGNQEFWEEDFPELK